MDISMSRARLDNDEGSDPTGRVCNAVASARTVSPRTATELSTLQINPDSGANDVGEATSPRIRNSARKKPILTRREKQVLESIANGNTATRASKILGVSAATVQTHLRNAQLKLQTANSLHTVVEAIRRSEIVV
jgi:DNA-binding CsgD family transcriptional regulator